MNYTLEITLNFPEKLNPAEQETLRTYAEWAALQLLGGLQAQGREVQGDYHFKEHPDWKKIGDQLDGLLMPFVARGELDRNFLDSVVRDSTDHTATVVNSDRGLRKQIAYLLEEGGLNANDVINDAIDRVAYEPEKLTQRVDDVFRAE